MHPHWPSEIWGQVYNKLCRGQEILAVLGHAQAMLPLASIGLELKARRPHEGFLWGPGHQGIHEVTLKTPQVLSVREAERKLR